MTVLKRWWIRQARYRFRAQYADTVRADVWALAVLYQYTPVPFWPVPDLESDSQAL